MVLRQTQKGIMKILDRILAVVQARLDAARKVIADYEAAKAAPQPEPTAAGTP